MVDLSCSIGDVSLEFCAMNAPRRGSISFDELSKLGKSKSGAIVTASMTLEPQEPNPEPNYYEFALGSVSSAGFPNLGYKKYGEMIPRLKQPGKPVIASIAGESLEDLAQIASYISGKGPDLIQLDFSYPIKLDGRSMGYRWDLMEKIIKQTKKLVRQPVGIMMPVMFETVSMEVLSLVLLRSEADFIVLIAPYRVGLIVDADREQSVLKSKSGIGQLAGPVIKPMALADVRLYYEQLGKRIPIIGAGGVSTGTDIFEYLLAGAVGVQVGTAFAREGTEIFSRLAAELSGIMEKKGYKTTREIVGKVKV